jgi:hypothetical protein
MKRLIALVAGVALVIGLANVALASSNNGHGFGARLDGFQETPTILSNATGTLMLRLDSTGTQLSYTLTYSGFSTMAMQSHIHLGRPGFPGGVAAFLCGGGGKPACPAAAGTVTGTITAADVIGPAGQGLAAGDFAGLLRAIRNNATYVNVHSTMFPAGEIRGAITGGEEDEQGEND